MAGSNARLRKNMSIAVYYDRDFGGHSVAAREYVRALQAGGQAAMGFPMLAREWELLASSNVEIAFQCFIPPLLRPLTGSRNIAIVFHEWDKMPAKWIASINRFDAVMVSSRYLENVLRQSGCTVPIHYVPVPIDISETPQKSSWQASKPFKFLSVGEWHFRKGFHLLIAAFKQAFPREGEAELQIKTSPGVDYSPDRDDIKIISSKLSDKEMIALYGGYDAYITTSLAEGLGLPVQEAMAAGLPVMAPNWGGLTEYCGEGRSIELPYAVTQQPFSSNPDYYAPGQQCAVVDIDACAEQMQKLACADATAREQMARKAKEYIEETFSSSKTQEMLSQKLL
jgi:glycosyltransferase involved in cell wall biosynthesis